MNNYTCKTCNETGLTWKHDTYGWKLYNGLGMLHKCSANNAINFKINTYKFLHPEFDEIGFRHWVFKTYLENANPFEANRILDYIAYETTMEHVLQVKAELTRPVQRPIVAKQMDLTDIIKQTPSKNVTSIQPRPTAKKTSYLKPLLKDKIFKGNETTGKWLTAREIINEMKHRHGIQIEQPSHLGTFLYMNKYQRNMVEEKEKGFMRKHNKYLVNFDNPNPNESNPTTPKSNFWEKVKQSIR